MTSNQLKLSRFQVLPHVAFVGSRNDSSILPYILLIEKSVPCQGASSRRRAAQPLLVSGHGAGRISAVLTGPGDSPGLGTRRQARSVSGQGTALPRQSGKGGPRLAVSENLYNRRASQDASGLTSREASNARRPIIQQHLVFPVSLSETGQSNLNHCLT